ncbi:xylose isomerase [Terriglobus aquaticus]|uniref:Xylose isomerase n=1 Tax=Terriglobus aquaticus TaxID=940139 RepID=A0ABW9KKB7_9BACT|nr:xylose isomerase [Terriglobus aquaticus]
MSNETIFSSFPTVAFEGPSSENELAYRWYDAERVVLGKPLKEHLRFAVAYWHSLAMSGSDPFGGPTIFRPWMEPGDPIAQAKVKADAAFELFRVLDLPFYCFHDADIAPPADTLAETLKNFHTLVDYLEEKQGQYKTKLLWGTANLFSHPRFMAGASTNPDPEVFAWCAATVKNCMDATKRLGGSNYVLWGGREGYETLLNTNLKQELDQMGRFLSLVVDYKHKIGFNGQILIEPKPKEPTSHQYDFDVATVYGFLKTYGLENEVRVNIEANHATLAGHSFEHEIASAGAFGILGSLDINRGDALLGWDTDQFPNDLWTMTMSMYHVIKAGGLGKGGCNFDAKVRRQSFTPEDMIYAHVGGADLCARAFLTAAKLIEDRKYDKILTDRYQGWQSGTAADMFQGKLSLEQIEQHALQNNLNPKPRSGRQEQIENLLARAIYTDKL